MQNFSAAHDQSAEVKSDSPNFRFVIAKHSSERVLETGLLMEALEKNRVAGTGTAQRPLSLVLFAKDIPRKVGLFRLFQEQHRRVPLQLRLAGGESWIRTSSTVLNY